MRISWTCAALTVLAACGGPGATDAGTDAGVVDATHDMTSIDAPGMDSGCTTDGDGDGHVSLACGGDDCDDADATRYPGHTEVCDVAGHDDDCNPSTLGPDADGDGFPYAGCCNGQPDGTTLCGTDCDDRAATISPTAVEACNGRDDDCDGMVDEAVLSAFCTDGEGDAHGELTTAAQGCAIPLGTTGICNDCADGDMSRHPGATELCNAIDDNCDGVVDEGCTCTMGMTRGCSVNAGACHVGVQGCPSGVWESACTGGVFPVIEVCNAVDDDCDGMTDEGVTFAFYPDCDGDGYGDDASVLQRCTTPAGVPPGCAHGTWAMVGGDCADTDPASYPGHGCTVDGGTPDAGADMGPTCAASTLDCTSAAGCETDCTTCFTACSWACRHSDCGAAAVQISSGQAHTCAREESGAVVCWGANYFGELGDGTATLRTTPVAVSGLVDAIDVSASSDGRTADSPHTCALRASGAVVCWGHNAEGQLGDGTMTDHRAPMPVSGLTDAIAVSAGGNAACALRTGSTISCWGYGVEGMLGNGASTNSTTPVPVSFITNAVQLSAGRDHACARLATGSLVCWGRNSEGQLGDGSLVNRNSPVAVATITDAIDVAASPANSTGGNAVSCAVRATGAVMCWGGNHYGQLGNGTLIDSPMPTGVSGVTDAVQVSLAKDVGCARRAGGTVVCWGINNLGQLGDGLMTHMTCTGFECSNVPVTVSGLADAVAISGGTSHMCALRANGIVVCWGGNPGGQLGNGSMTNSYVPLPVTSPP